LRCFLCIIFALHKVQLDQDHLLGDKFVLPHITTHGENYVLKFGNLI